MKHAKPLDLASLPGLSFDELRALWTEHMGRSAAPVQKRLLIRELAWRVQARERGGLDAATRKLLSAAMRDAVRGAKSADRATSAHGTDPESQDIDSRTNPANLPASARPRRRATRNAAAPLAPATRLVREWRGARHQVHALDGGSFRYRDQTFKTLSEVARAITGTRWSGPRFFGITTRSEPRDGP